MNDSSKSFPDSADSASPNIVQRIIRAEHIRNPAALRALWYCRLCTTHRVLHGNYQSNAPDQRLHCRVCLRATIHRKV